MIKYLVVYKVLLLRLLCCSLWAQRTCTSMYTMYHSAALDKSLIIHFPPCE